MTLPLRRAQTSWGPVVISLAAAVVVLAGGLLINGCRINKLLSRSSDHDNGGGVILVEPPEVRDSALAGATAPRVANLAVTNGGAWTASTTQDWIHVTATTGRTRGTMRLSLDPKNLAPGMHTGVVTVREESSEGLSATVPVKFLIQQPVLKVQPDKFEFRARTNNSVFRDTVYITNEGTGPLVWTATTEKHSAWLRFESDTAGTGPGILALRASNAGLSYFGTFKETIIVASPGAKNSPRRIDVSIRRRHGDDDDDDASIP